MHIVGTGRTSENEQHGVTRAVAEVGHDFKALLASRRGATRGRCRNRVKAESNGIG